MKIATGGGGGGGKIEEEEGIFLLSLFGFRFIRESHVSKVRRRSRRLFFLLFSLSPFFLFPILGCELRAAVIVRQFPGNFLPPPTYLLFPSFYCFEKGRREKRRLMPSNIYWLLLLVQKSPSSSPVREKKEQEKRLKYVLCVQTAEREGNCTNLIFPFPLFYV